ncbi:MAG: chaperone NapD [Nitrospirae bacterium]|nr:chaperone NapD [Nitrospirota bacterium]
MIVKTAPEHLNEVLGSLGHIGNCDIHFKDESGKIVVTVEADTKDEIVKKMKDLADIKHVLTVDLAYTYSGSDI